MADWPLNGGCSFPLADNLSVGCTKYFSAWSEIVASLAHPIVGVLIHINDVLNHSSLIFELAKGASGSEVALGAHIFMVATNGGAHTNQIFVPVQANMGDRLSIRWRGSYTSTRAIEFAAVGFFRDFASPMLYTGCDQLGLVTDTEGTTPVITPISNNSTVDVYGAYTEIESSVARDYKAVALQMQEQVGNPDNNDHVIFVKLAIGAIGSEQDILVDYPIRWIYDSFSRAESVIVPCQIPAGSRVSMAIKKDSPTDFLISGAFVGYY